MSYAWLFNPENDVALAADTSNFTAPPGAREMARAGQMLPFFLAADDDAVIIDGVNAAWFENFSNRFGIKAEIWNHRPEGFTPVPWGWSAYTRRRFEHLGFAKSSLPTDSRLAVWRALSHRRTAARIADILAAETSLPLRPAAVEVFDPEVLRTILSDWRTAVIKTPWSSSGRGVKFYTGVGLENIVSQAAGTIRRQGSIMVERFVDGHRDFALLFECHNGCCRFVGPSVFIADAYGRYKGNLVAADRLLFDEIHRIITAQRLATLIDALTRAITRTVAGVYTGPVGVDICIAPDGDIHLCELNLRFTMGFVARAIAPKINFVGCVVSAPHDKVPEKAVLLTPPGINTVFCLSENPIILAQG